MLEQGLGIACQQQERGLKHVVGVGRLGHDASSGVPHHGRVPPKQHAESRLVASVDIAPEQLLVPGPADVATGRQSANTLHDGSARSGQSEPPHLPLPQYVRGQAK
jgi:hypothetical protein